MFIIINLLYLFYGQNDNPDEVQQGENMRTKNYSGMYIRDKAASLQACKGENSTLHNNNNNNNNDST